MLNSPDFVTWSALTVPTTATLRHVAYNTTASEGIYVAVGDSGTLLSSLNGVDWIKVSSPTSANLRSITYGSRFVAVGDAGTILYSDDGSTWSVGTSGIASQLTSVLRALGVYYAVGAGGIVLSSS